MPKTKSHRVLNSLTVRKAQTAHQLAKKSGANITTVYAVLKNAVDSKLVEVYDATGPRNAQRYRLAKQTTVTGFLSELPGARAKTSIMAKTLKTLQVNSYIILDNNERIRATLGHSNRVELAVGDTTFSLSKSTLKTIYDLIG